MHCSSSFTRRQRRRKRRWPSLRNQIDKVRVAVRSVRYTHALTCTGMSQRVPACPDLFLYYPDSLFDSLVFAFAISLCQAPEKLQIRQHLIFIYLSSIPPYPFPPSPCHSTHPFRMDTHMCVQCNRAAKGHAWPICSPFN